MTGNSTDEVWRRTPSTDADRRETEKMHAWSLEVSSEHSAQFRAMQESRGAKARGSAGCAQSRRAPQDIGARGVNDPGTAVD